MAGSAVTETAMGEAPEEGEKRSQGAEEEAEKARPERVLPRVTSFGSVVGPPLVAVNVRAEGEAWRVTFRARTERMRLLKASAMRRSPARLKASARGEEREARVERSPSPE